jgi:hypothetical protein
MTDSTSRPERSLPVLAAGVAVVLALQVLLVLVAALDLPLAFAAVLLVAVVTSHLLARHLPSLAGLLRQVHLEPESVGLLQTLAFGILVGAHFDHRSRWETVLVFGILVGMPVCRTAVEIVMVGLRGRLLPPVETRNIDLGPLELADVVPGGDTDRTLRRMLDLGQVILVAGAFGVAADQVWPVLLLGGGYDLVLVSWVGWVAVHGALTRSRLSAAQWEQRVMERVRALEPEVILYFSGSPEATYQLNMWLEPLADLGRPALVLVRERHIMQSLAPTDLPVVCLPGSVSVMQAKLSTAKVVLYAAHSSKNLHMLREPGMQHVFIGHGDSDKVSSINPFAKAYDEVWVAGPAGRDRWAESDAGVRDDAVVEVGRPQLQVVKRTDPGARPDGPLTVLYAPTWEGWTDEDFGSSVVSMGPELVRQLLAADPPIRVVYKPHPLTGIRDRAAARSHGEIVDLLAGADWAPSPQLVDLDVRLNAPGISAPEHRALAAEWSREFWEEHPSHGHVVVDGPLPDLYDCFNHCDVLVADVSSVVSDFLASGKPYVCANPRGTRDDVFRAENPTTRAAYLLGPDLVELAEVLAALAGPDPLAGVRRAMREYLLGPDEPPAIDRWRAAVDRLVAVAGHRAARA